MTSKLLQSLAALPGINWFNHKDKIAANPDDLNRMPVINNNETFAELRMKADKYFSRIQAMKKYIEAINHLLDEYNGTVIRWDEIQSKHEEEMEAARSGPIGLLKSLLQQREAQIKKLENRVRDLDQKKNKQKPIILTKDVDKLIAHLDLVSSRVTYSRDKEAKKYGQMAQALHNFLQKLMAHAEGIE